jgi:hypothetical protein
MHALPALLPISSVDQKNNKNGNGLGDIGVTSSTCAQEARDETFDCTKMKFKVEKVRLHGAHAMRQCNAEIPLTIVSSATSQAAPTFAGFVGLPVVIWLHATGGSAALMQPRLLAYAAMGFLAVAMDCRYHGERQDGCEGGMPSHEAYQQAIYKCELLGYLFAWRLG